MIGFKKELLKKQRAYLQIVGILLGIERRKIKHLSIHKIIIGDDTSVLPEKQKYICSNKTLGKIEKGYCTKNLHIYDNIAKKLNREIDYNEDFEKILIEIAASLLKDLNQNSWHSHNYYFSRLQILSSTNLIYYHEMYLLLNTCVSFLVFKKHLDIHLFENVHLYLSYLPMPLQKILTITQTIYDFHVHYKEEKTMNIDLPQFTMYDSLIKKKLFDHQLLQIYINPQRVEYPELAYNDWINGAIHADFGFFYCLLQKHQEAYECFKKAIQIHPILVAKYLPALYLSAPSQSAFIAHLSTLHTISDLQDHISFFMLIANKKKIPKSLTSKIKHRFQHHLYSHYSNYNFFFLHQLKKRKS